MEVYSEGNYLNVATGCAVTGRTLAIATVRKEGVRCDLSENCSRIFRLGEHSQAEVRKVAAEVHQFVSERQLRAAAFCRPMINAGDFGDTNEGLLEAILYFIPPLKVEVFNEEKVLQWVIRSKRPMPSQFNRRKRPVAQVRAIEVAQFTLEDRTVGN